MIGSASRRATRLGAAFSLLLFSAAATAQAPSTPAADALGASLASLLRELDQETSQRVLAPAANRTVAFRRLTRAEVLQSFRGDTGQTLVVIARRGPRDHSAAEVIRVLRVRDLAAPMTRLAAPRGDAYEATTPTARSLAQAIASGPPSTPDPPIEEVSAATALGILARSRDVAVILGPTSAAQATKLVLIPDSVRINISGSGTTGSGSARGDGSEPIPSYPAEEDIPPPPPSMVIDPDTGLPSSTAPY